MLDVTDPGHIKREDSVRLDAGGLYIIRRPAVEMRKKARELDVELGIAGAG